MSKKLIVLGCSVSCVAVAVLGVMLLRAGQANSRLNQDYGANQVRIEVLEGERKKNLETIAKLQQNYAALDRKRQQLEERQAELVAANEELTELAAEMELELNRLAVSRRRALVSDVSREGGFTEFELVEIDQVGTPVGRRIRHRIEGDILKLDWYEIRWRSAVARSDPDRSFPIFLLRGVYGDNESPADGRRALSPDAPELTLDARGIPPAVYNPDNTVSASEAIIWEQFWDVSHKPELAESFGVESATLNSVGQQLRPGYEYEWVITGGGSSHVVSRRAKGNSENPS